MSSPLEGEESRKTHKNVRRRPRATSACLDCRRRKVRCDVVLRRPCSNCQLDEYDCQVMARRPKRAGSCGACTQQGDGTDFALPTFLVENYPASSSTTRLSSGTEAKQEQNDTPTEPTTPRSPGRLGSFNDYVSIMATEMSFLENNGFLAAAAVVVVLQETTVQRLLIRQRDPQVRGDAIIRLRRCRDTIKKLRGRQTSLGHRADHLDRVLLEIKKDIQHFDNAGRTDEAPCFQIRLWYRHLYRVACSRKRRSQTSHHHH
ncbi:hypothetical protein V2G26_019346 [Clonostachys chloroleuca]